MIDVKELKILNRKDCRQCGHEFTLTDVKGLEKLADAHGFYGNLVKNCSIVECPECNNKTILLLKQTGQTWEIMNTAVTENQNEKVIETENIIEDTESQNKEESNQDKEFICPVCKKVCKNQLGLNAHMRTHQN